MWAGAARSRQVLLAVAAGVLVALSILGGVRLSQSSSSGSDTAFADVPYSNGDAANTRYVRGPIRAASVDDLEVAWQRPIYMKNGFGGSTSSPVVGDGVVFTQDVASNVQAIDVESGDLLWEHRFETLINGLNGMVVADDLVYGTTSTDVFALDRESGEEVWSTAMVRGDSERILMPPGYHDGLLYVSVSPFALEGGEAGTLWALDAKSGRKVWHFDTVPKALWGNTEINYGGGMRHSPAFDEEGSMYFGVGTPGPAPGTEELPWGSSRPGPNLYTNSIVKLDARTGELEWYFQVTPHGVTTADVAAPLLAEAGGRDLVLAAGRAGVVVALDRRTGKQVWRRPVGAHSGPENIGLIAMRGEYSKLATPFTIYPGNYGGVAAASAANDSTVFVPVINYGVEFHSQIEREAIGDGSGEIVALDTSTGIVRWKREFPAPVSGAPAAVNDLVFAATDDGAVVALDAEDGKVMWRDTLPAGLNGGIAASGDTLLVPAGNVPEGEEPQFVAYRLRR